MQLSKAKQKYVRLLHQKKYRQKYNKFLVEGDKIVNELLGQKRISYELVIALPEWADSHQIPSDRLGIVDENTLKSLSSLSTPNHVMAIAEMGTPGRPFDLPENDICLYLDGIRDPGNLGAILRVADWFGIPRVFCSPDTVDVYNPKVVQASMGAILRVATPTIDIEELLARAEGWPVLGAMLQGNNAYQTDFPPKGILLIGNESSGLRPEAMDKIDTPIYIPRHAGGGAESLNAAVATGILCALLRQHGQGGADAL